MPTRLQIAVYDILVAEVVFENFTEADKAWHDWCRIRYMNGHPMGGAAICNVNTKKVWDVPVGAEIQIEKEGKL